MIHSREIEYTRQASITVAHQIELLQDSYSVSKLMIALFALSASLKEGNNSWIAKQQP
ncbi:hypothetical protein IQ250_02080 [Pseudanabaenaceae cyanobacterium LEGE 13415]|nr:hypothetical protein [Pseudanabaenaceae cyanobacterium LEGE 13415]